VIGCHYTDTFFCNVRDNGRDRTRDQTVDNANIFLDQTMDNVNIVLDQTMDNVNTVLRDETCSLVNLRVFIYLCYTSM
jgi:hypothetical protein